MGAIWRILSVTALVPWLAVSAAIPPEHVHESDAPDHAAVVHQHFAPHTHDRSTLSTSGHDAAEIEDPGEHVVWLDEVGLAEAWQAFPALLAVVSAYRVLAPQPLRHAVVEADIATLPHGPPRASLSLRGPPPVFL